MVVTTVLGLAGCGRGGVEVIDDQALADAVNAVIDARETKPLRELAAGEWDQVQVFLTEAVTRDRIEQTLGERVDMPEIFMGKESLLFFKKDGRVARASKIGPNAFEEGVYSGEVLVDGSRGNLAFREPGGR